MSFVPLAPPCHGDHTVDTVYADHSMETHLILSCGGQVVATAAFADGDGGEIFGFIEHTWSGHRIHHLRSLLVGLVTANPGLVMPSAIVDDIRAEL